MRGLAFDLEDMKLSPQTLTMLRLIEKGQLSVNIGGTDELAAGTLAYKLNLPMSLHGGITYPWSNVLNLKFTRRPGIFAGFEIRF